MDDMPLFAKRRKFILKILILFFWLNIFFISSISTVLADTETFQTRLFILPAETPTPPAGSNYTTGGGPAPTSTPAPVLPPAVLIIPKTSSTTPSVVEPLGEVPSFVPLEIAPSPSGSTAPIVSGHASSTALSATSSLKSQSRLRPLSAQQQEEKIISFNTLIQSAIQLIKGDISIFLLLYILLGLLICDMIIRSGPL